MRLLVLGGTIFVGRHFIEHAIERGHEVTLLHRGQRGADLFPDVRRVLTDRDGGLGALPDESWDAVLDTSGYVPRVVRQSVEALSGRVGRYLFISTISVYADSTRPHQDESAPMARLEDPTVEAVTPETYGGLKALCEEEVQRGFGERALIVRPGLIVGPHDPSDRFTHWVERFGRGGPVLLPDRASEPMQWIDARDLARFLLLGLERSLAGVYTATGQERERTFGDLISILQRQHPHAEPVWVDEAFLDAHGVRLWQDLPLVQSSKEGADGLQRMDVSKAVAAGLSFRPWEETAADTWNWVKTLDPERPRRYGIDRSRELAVLDAWSKRT